jgi:malate dehydrogenase (quinone)
MKAQTHPDVALVGASIMSATLATLLKQVQPGLTMEIFESLDSVAGESSNAWNNAGTGHAALCELNYTPQRADGSVDVSKALEINESFEVSKQFWSYSQEALRGARKASSLLQDAVFREPSGIGRMDATNKGGP